MSDLREKIKERILEQSKITFADFMEAALYYPGLGYYTSSIQRVGAEGDFFTSPATQPVFATLISLQLEQMWHLLGCPANFTLVEMGAGKGLLARDILGYLPHLSPRFAQSIEYIAIERGSVSALRGTSGFSGASSVQVARALPLRGIIGCFLSNELLDTFPTHKVIMRDGRLQEVYVTVEDDNFVEVVGNPSTPLLAEQLSQEGITLPEGYCTEVNLNIAPWMEQVADSLEKGFVITNDYGYLASELYASERHRGTLMTYYRHTCASDPYVRTGDQDITTHVDFTAAILSGERKGLRFVALLSQREFLLNLGLDIFIEALAEKGLSNHDYIANRFSMLELIRPEGMGNFKVLIQSKGVTAAPLYGTTPDNEGKKALQTNKKALEVPLLEKNHMPLLQAKYPHRGFDLCLCRLLSKWWP
ncbi:MAG: class I SAM-dependent methyltransferase [Anaerolineae bacterium]|nr:class I SAM-dependent methyltransferase [Anaerolineae bacterium]